MRHMLTALLSLCLLPMAQRRQISQYLSLFYTDFPQHQVTFLFPLPHHSSQHSPHYPSPFSAPSTSPPPYSYSSSPFPSPSPFSSYSEGVDGASCKSIWGNGTEEDWWWYWAWPVGGSTSSSRAPLFKFLWEDTAHHSFPSLNVDGTVRCR